MTRRKQEAAAELESAGVKVLAWNPAAVLSRRCIHFAHRVTKIGDPIMKKILAQAMKEWRLFRRDQAADRAGRVYAGCIACSWRAGHSP